MNGRILVIEDESNISMPIRDELEFEGFNVEVLEDGSVGLKAILQEPPDLVVLDLVLPGLNGFEICKEVRRRGIDVPILMLTARSEEADRVRGLNLGADDYIIKPFSLAELVARVRANLRRWQTDDLRSEQTSFQLGQLRLDPKKREVVKGDQKINLVKKEYELLELLFRQQGNAVSRDEFLDAIWGEEVYVTPRTVDTHMSSLRKKIEKDPHRPEYILSVWGVGYKLNNDLTDS